MARPDFPACLPTHSSAKASVGRKWRLAPRALGHRGGIHLGAGVAAQVILNDMDPISDVKLSATVSS